jgi:hypothetical protein
MADPTRLAKGRRLDGRPLVAACHTGRRLLGCFDAAEQPTDFGLPVAAMPTQGADARQLACLSPPGDGATYAVPIDVNRGIQP